MTDWSGSAAKLFLQDEATSLRIFERFLAFIGLIFLLKVLLMLFIDIVTGIRTHICSKLWKRNFVKKFGKWAVVTGSTDGIGKSYAEEFAKEGMNVILVARNESKLKNVSNMIAEKYHVEVETIKMDFSEGKPIYDGLERKLQDKEIGILVNNVGTCVEYPKYYNEITQDEIWNHVNVNIASICMMTCVILPQMLARGKGAIVNIGSISCFGPIPLLSIYAASKAFVDSFSQALTWEFKGEGLIIQTVNPSYVATKMIEYSSLIGTANFVTPTAAEFARQAVNTISYAKRTTGHWVHDLEMWFLENFVPRGMFISFSGMWHQILQKDSKKRLSAN